MNTDHPQPMDSAPPTKAGTNVACEPDVDPRLTEAVAWYMERLESGEHPDRQQILAEYPDLSDTLATCLDGVEFICRIAPDLRQSVGDTSVEAVLQRQLPARLGDFRIIRQIGRGGMGVVYEAEQLSLSRRVALKVLPFAAILDQRQLQRFKNEAQAAAMLRHSHIVAVHAVGCERGVHFYAMDLIAGKTLAQVIEQLRRQPSAATAPNASARLACTAHAMTDGESNAGVEAQLPPSANDTAPMAALSTQYSHNPREFFRSVARLGIQAAEALEYAHQMGVIHRDIKPSNMLLDERGHLWITDFGLAQVQGNHQLTMSGDLLGTLRYMSPEQAVGKALLDQRTDVYSLGVTLYELMTLRPAFDCQLRQQLLQYVVEQDPPAPRKLVNMIPKDLETIVLKAIAKDPIERYESAAQMAADLRSFLDQKPIKARPAGRMRHLWRWASRNRWLAVLLLSAGTLLCVLAIGGPLAAWKLKSLAMREAAARRSAEISHAEAEGHRRNLEEILDRILIGTADTLAQTPRMQQMQQQLVQDALGYYERLLRDHGDDPEIRFQTASTYRRLARIKRLANRPRETTELCRKSISLLSELVDHFPRDQRYRFDLAEAERLYGNHLTNDMADPETAIPHLENAVELSKGLVVNDADSALYNKKLVDCLHFFSIALKATGRIIDAAGVQRQAYVAAQQFTDRWKTEESMRHVGLGASPLGGIYLEIGRFDESEQYLLRAQAVFESLPNALLTKKPEHMASLAEHQIRCGHLYLCLRAPSRAEAYYRRAVATSEQLLNAYPDFGWGKSTRVSAYEGLSDSLLALGRAGDAEQALQTALAQQLDLMNMSGGTPSATVELARLEAKTAQLYWWTGQETKAHEQFTTVRDRLERSLASHPEMRAFQRQLAVLLATYPDPALRDPLRAVELCRAVVHNQDPSSWQLVGVAHVHAGNGQKAVDALGSNLRLTGGDPFSWGLLAMAHWQLENAQEASRWYGEFIKGIENAQPLQLTTFTHELYLEDLRRELDRLVRSEPTPPAPTSPASEANS